MEALISTAIPSPSSPLSVFSPSKSRPLRSVSVRNIPLASKGGVNEPDRRSDEFEKGLIIGGHGLSLSPLSKDAAMGLVLSAAAGRGWTTGSGMEGPAEPLGYAGSSTARISTFPWSLFTKSPRRRMLIAFTCNICTQRTTRAINPHAYTDGTVFVQCCGCNAYHKLVDNLNLFTDMKCYIDPSFNQGDQAKLSFEYQDIDDGKDDLFGL
ncbi:Mitochondrial protein import protein ZIM17-like protein [Drosera capensis]